MLLIDLFMKYNRPEPFRIPASALSALSSYASHLRLPVVSSGEQRAEPGGFSELVNQVPLNFATGLQANKYKNICFY